MIELQRDRLHFSFPEVHPSATVTLEFQRTLRIPDDNRTHRLPPGLGAFALRHVDDGSENVPTEWLTHGGVMLPMYQAEAMWIRFSAGHDDEREVAYPFAIRVAAGKINAVTGQQWTDGLHEDPQDYVVSPPQPWLDGFCVTKGTIRQFVAMPLGQGYTAEEQITGTADYGGVQIVVYPMKREIFERRFKKSLQDRMAPTMRFAMMARPERGRAASMGLAPGGRMKQDIYDDPFNFDDWDHTQRSRCLYTSPTRKCGECSRARHRQPCRRAPLTTRRPACRGSTTTAKARPWKDRRFCAALRVCCSLARKRERCLCPRTLRSVAKRSSRFGPGG